MRGSSAAFCSASHRVGILVGGEKRPPFWSLIAPPSCMLSGGRCRRMQGVISYAAHQSSVGGSNA